jgi:DNA polymerase
MTVEETLAILGVRAGSPGVASADSSAGPQVAPHAAAPPADVQRDAPIERAPDAVPSDIDWRQALRAAGASPSGEPMPKKKTRDAEPASEAPHSAASKPSAPDTASPAATPPLTTPTSTTFVSPLSDTPAGLSVGAPMAELTGGEFAELNTLDKIVAHVAACTRCTLFSTAKNPVPGEGNPNADFMCVGEAPGATEDETGRPFIGAAGQLLTKILAAINLSREDVYICNVLKHRPPGNRNPKPEEVAACSPYLIRQIELIRPKVILALGTFAAQTLLDTKLSIGKLRGQVHRYYGVPLIVTYHPAALLRNPAWKRPTWEDVQLAHRILNSAAESKPGA